MNPNRLLFRRRVIQDTTSPMFDPKLSICLGGIVHSMRLDILQMTRISWYSISGVNGPGCLSLSAGLIVVLIQMAN
jgi:hypothetical protein